MVRSNSIQQSFQVQIDFKLIFTSHLFNTKNDILLNTLKNNGISKVISVLDSGVSKAHPLLKEQIQCYFEHHKNHLSLEGDVLIIEGGEASKNNEEHIKTILENVHQHKIDRHSYILAIGGGALLDAVGYAAAIAHRGVRLVRVPTTVLSQNDSGIGVKNGINYFEKKNFVGTFAAPFAVINDDVFLTSLEDRDWRSGISEALKVALIKDAPFFYWIMKHINDLNQRNLETMNQLIYKCAELHMSHIQNSGDAFEQGSSRPLDFGHWSAHKLEQLSNFEIRHGEAVAIGIALDSTYSYLKNYITKIELHHILDTIISLGFEISYTEMNNNILKGLEEFREHLGGELTIMLLKNIGNGFEVHQIDEELVLKSITYMNNHKANL